MKSPSMRMWMCSLPPLCAGLGQTSVHPMAGSAVPPMQDFTLVLREGCCCAEEASGSGQSCDLCRSSWPRSLLASAGVGAGFCTWWNPCQRLGHAGMALSSLLHLHGDMQEAVQMEICKREREINWSWDVISQESGEVSCGCFSP